VFLSENCAAIPETLLESELFGHVRGAFTGADRDRRGLFEQADGGTLFLDEVGDMSPSMQARLLRALQEGEIRRVGGDRPIRVDVRVLAATHRDLVREVEAGRFREDLFYRLQVLLVRIPPLRERSEDIDLLVDHFLERIARERGRPSIVVAPEVRTVLRRHPWPGNVRQLENVLQRLTLLSGEGPVTVAALLSEEAFRDLLPDAPGAARTFSIQDGVREQVRRALDAAKGDREQAARLLGVSRATIYRKIKDLGL
jgi:transcriptional regulator with PAS, ATPase and Fis domain